MVAKPFPLQLKVAETIAMGRLGHTTKKLVIYATFDLQTGSVQEVSFLSIGVDFFRSVTLTMLLFFVCGQVQAQSSAPER